MQNENSISMQNFSKEYKYKHKEEFFWGPDFEIYIGDSGVQDRNGHTDQDGGSGVQIDEMVIQDGGSHGNGGSMVFSDQNIYGSDGSEVSDQVHGGGSFKKRIGGAFKTYMAWFKLLCDCSDPNLDPSSDPSSCSSSNDSIGGANESTCGGAIGGTYAHGQEQVPDPHETRKHKRTIQDVCRSAMIRLSSFKPEAQVLCEQTKEGELIPKEPGDWRELSRMISAQERHEHEDSEQFPPRWDNEYIYRYLQKEAFFDHAHMLELTVDDKQTFNFMSNERTRAEQVHSSPNRFWQEQIAKRPTYPALIPKDDPELMTEQELKRFRDYLALKRDCLLGPTFEGYTDWRPHDIKRQRLYKAGKYGSTGRSMKPIKTKPLKPLRF